MGKVSYDFTILDGIQSTEYYTPNLGKKSYNLGEGSYTGGGDIICSGIKFSYWKFYNKCSREVI